MQIEENLKRRLAVKPNADSKVLSVYLGIQPVWETSMGHAVEMLFDTAIASLQKNSDEGDAAPLERTLRLARDAIRQREWKPGGYALFAQDKARGLEIQELGAEVKTQAYWLEKPYLLPWIEALEESKRCGVILADKRRARVLTYRRGSIEEEKDLTAAESTRRFRTTGKDNLKSAFKLERTADLHEVWHLKRVIREAQALEKKHPFTRLMLGGTEESVHELENLLTPDLSAKVAGRFKARVEAQDQELLEHLEELETAADRDSEMRFVESLLKDDRPRPEVTLGLDAVLHHLDRGLVHRLVYSENFKPEGSQCTSCRYLFGPGRLVCGRCNSAVSRVPYLLEEMVRSALLQSGQIEKVRGEAARRLDHEGGTAAILKKKSKR